MPSTPYAADTYDTPPESRRCLTDRLLLGTNWYFAAKVFYHVFRGGALARKGPSYEEFLERYVECSIGVIEATERCGGKISVRGGANISAVPGPVVIVGNHMSFLETNFLASIIIPRKRISFVVKNSLLRYPYFGDILRMTRAIGVDRKNPIEDFKTIMTQGEALLRDGCSIVIFPQHTRSEVFDPSDFNSVGVKLAKRVGAPIIPLALKTDFCGKGRIVKDIGALRRDRKIFLEFGAPIAIVGNGKAEHQKVIDFISEKLKGWGGRVAGPQATKE